MTNITTHAADMDRAIDKMERETFEAWIKGKNTSPHHSTYTWEGWKARAAVEQQARVQGRLCTAAQMQRYGCAMVDAVRAQQAEVPEVAEWQSRYVGDPCQPGQWERSADPYWAQETYDAYSNHTRHGWEVRPLYAARPSSCVEHCQCHACRGGVIHASDCAVHNEPAYPSGPCDCGAESSPVAAVTSKPVGYVNRNWLKHGIGTTTIYPYEHPRLATAPLFTAPVEAGAGEVVAWGTLLPSGKFHAVRTDERSAQRRTDAWNARFPRPPHAVTVPLYTEPQAGVVSEIVGWVYELATAHNKQTGYTDWVLHMGRTKPNVPEDSMRNLRALTYANQPTGNSVSPTPGNNPGEPE